MITPDDVLPRLDGVRRSGRGNIAECPAHRTLEFLLSNVYDRSELHHEHLADLRKSGLSAETIAMHKLRSVPPSMIDQLLGFAAPKVQSAYIIPFADPHGGWMDHVRMKVFPAITTEKGTIKYLQPRRSGVRIYFPFASLDQALHSDGALYIVEGEKKTLAVAQLGVAAVGIAGVDAWHIAGSRDLHPDFDDVGLRGRIVNVIPDGDVKTKPAVASAVRRLGAALAARGATAKLMHVPAGFKGIDDFLAAGA